MPLLRVSANKHTETTMTLGKKLVRKLLTFIAWIAVAVLLIPSMWLSSPRPTYEGTNMPLAQKRVADESWFEAESRRSTFRFRAAAAVFFAALIGLHFNNKRPD
jgi:hypothetical protein